MSLFNAQDVPENLNMAKMSLSPTTSDKPSTVEKEEDKNGIHCILNNLIYSDRFISKHFMWILTYIINIFR